MSEIEKIYDRTDFNYMGTMLTYKATQKLEKQLREKMKENAIYAIDFAKKVKAAEFKPYLASVQRLLLAQNVPAAAAKEITNLPRIVTAFGGGADEKILDSIWNKVWPDSLTVDDRIKRLSIKSRQFAEMTVKQGISQGKSAVNIANELQQHFLVDGVEHKAAIRLAAHTTNMCYQAMQAEISIQAKFVMGVRIKRGVYGRISENCPICMEHAGLTYKEYYKSDFGGRDMDMWIMTNAPAYHSYCNCGVETIYEDAVTFVRKAREEYEKSRFKNRPFNGYSEINFKTY